MASLTEHIESIQDALRAAESDGYDVSFYIDEDICCMPKEVEIDICVRGEYNSTAKSVWVLVY